MPNYSPYNQPNISPYRAVSGTETKKKKRARSAWDREDTSPIQLCKGVEIDSSVYEISENRYFTLILKGFIVYLITAGGIGAYLTALDISFNQIVFNIVILITAIICATLYHSWKSENLGYLVFFAIYASFVFLLKDYINSGFYAVLNDTIDRASIYFDTEGLQYYNERITNRYAAITISMIIIGIAANVLLNNYILRRARYMVAIYLALTVNIAAFYMLNEPDTIYTIMVLFGIVMTFVLKCGRHFYLSRRDHIFSRTKRGLTYALDYKSLWQGMVTVGIFVMVIVATLSTVYNKTFYDYEREPSAEKEDSREVFQNFIMLGFFGIIDYYPNNGGLSTGELGGVSSIRLDYMTDITIIYTPYSNETLYIKNFTGDTYHPFENKWSHQDESFSNTYPNEVHDLKKAYEDGAQNTSRGVMTVTNVEAPALSYQPYYSEGDTKPVFTLQSQSYTYYTRLPGNATVVDGSKPDPIYLEVPEQNKEAVDEFIKTAGITDGTPLEIVAQIRDYYQENVPYTVRPGATPWRQDFVNYFLTENKKGYCAHFASAATLILREKGIPARYCEGYAVSFNQVADNGKLLEDANYSDYYDGYNAFGETAPVRVDATDADAHAWVEIYDDELGWLKVEVTPSSRIEDEDEEDTSFWDSFNNIFGDGDETSAERDSSDDTTFNVSAADTVMRYVAFVIIGLVILSLLVFLLLKFYPTIKYHYDYGKADRSDKLILKYSRYIKKLKKKDKGLRNKVNYQEQMDYLLPDSEADRERMIDILERAGFSKHEISETDFSFADSMIEKIYRK